MNKKLIFSVLSAVLFALVSCGSPSTTNPVTNPEVTNSEALYSKIGVVNKVYKASSAARFFTGQRISNIFGCSEVEFTGVLVEYDSLNEKVLDYVKNLPKENAYIHQHYPDIVYNKDEVYVEFSTYTDTANNEIIAHEIRIFHGDFLDHFDGSSYAKAVLFDPTLTIDLDRNKNVMTGEYEDYSSYYTFNGAYYVLYKSVNDFPAELSKYGTISEVYVVVDSNNQIKKRKMNDQQYYITYYAEYSSLNAVTQQYYNNRKNLYTYFTHSEDFYIDSSMKYIQFFYVYDNDTDNNSWAEACISDPKDFPELDYGVEIEPLHFYNSCTELYSKMEYLSKSEFKEINSNNYPEDFSKYGNVNKVYACVFNDGTIADEYNNEQRYYETYYVDYSSFNDVAMKAYKFAKNRGYHFCTKPEKYCVDGKFFMIYRKINVDNAYEINCDFYTPEEPRNSYGISDQYTVCNGTYPDFYAFLASGAYSQ